MLMRAVLEKGVVVWNCVGVNVSVRTLVMRDEARGSTACVTVGACGYRGN